MNRLSKERNTMVTVLSVLLMVAVCMTPLASDTSDAAVAGTYDINMCKGQTWTTSIGYTASLAPTAYVKVATSESDASSSTGWSVGTSDSTSVNSGTSSATVAYVTAQLDTTAKNVGVSVTIGSQFASKTAYIGIKLTTSNPSQSAVTVLKVHVIDPSFTTSYTGGSFYNGQTVTAQTPVVSSGNSDVTPKAVTYAISTGSNGATLSANTGLTFNTSNGSISGTVSKTTNSQVTYTVTATMTFASGYPAAQTVATTVNIGSYTSASLANSAAYAITNVDTINVAKPTTSGITYVLTGASYTLDGGSSKTVTAGTAFNGITVASDGSVSGKPTVSGVYAINETFRVSETGQTASRTVTVTAEDQVKVSVADGTVNRYTGNATAGNLLTTASHTETKKVTGTWSITNGNTNSCFAIGSDGKITVAKAPAAGTYTLTLKYTSSASSTNSATTTVKICVDPALVLSCSDADRKLYAATTSTYLDNGQDGATISQTATLVAGSKTVTYALSCSDGSKICDYVSISATGVVTIADTITDSCIGSHTVRVTCTDVTVSANVATMDLTVTVVAGMSLQAPAVGQISSH